MDNLKTPRQTGKYSYVEAHDQNCLRASLKQYCKYFLKSLHFRKAVKFLKFFSLHKNVILIKKKIDQF